MLRWCWQSGAGQAAGKKKIKEIRTGTSLLISNLDVNVTEDDVKVRAAYGDMLRTSSLTLAPGYRIYSQTLAH